MTKSLVEFRGRQYRLAKPFDDFDDLLRRVTLNLQYGAGVDNPEAYRSAIRGNIVTLFPDAEKVVKRCNSVELFTLAMLTHKAFADRIQELGSYVGQEMTPAFKAFTQKLREEVR